MCFACKSLVMDKSTNKAKIEAYLVQSVKSKFETLCESKGISLADGLRRAIELWIEKESNSLK